MYHIRFHGRGGQGVKTASRILGKAFFLSGYEVQDAPRYGGERRGAPIYAYVRANQGVIHERGVIYDPDLVIAVDESLLTVPPAGVLDGVSENTVLLVSSTEEADTLKSRHNIPGQVVPMSLLKEGEGRASLPFVAAACAGAAARLVGVISRDALREAIREELEMLGESIVAANLEWALSAYDNTEDHANAVTGHDEPTAEGYIHPKWTDLKYESGHAAMPNIHGFQTSRLIKTGLWRTERPVIDTELCKHCWWVCTTYCPDNAIDVSEDGLPDIDYDYCKGCMICMVQCPPHAISSVIEKTALMAEQQGAKQ